VTAPRTASPNRRKALSHLGGPTRVEGDAAIGEVLRSAFDIELDDSTGRAHVHGFHSYPARLHPATAQRVLKGMLTPGGEPPTVLDPFCGSGTVLVEARLLGARAIGTDVNPLAIRLARLKTRGSSEADRKALVDAAKFVRSVADKRRAQKARPSKRYEDEDVRLFDPHVLLELDSMRTALDRVEPQALREDLELVFSSILTKVSKRRGDTGAYLDARRLAPGFTAKLLFLKTEELVRAMDAYQRALPKDAPPADVHPDDARTLGTIGAGRVDLVLTSPPYAATYDYVDHHDVRLRWLGLRIDRFADLELGARRDYAQLSHLAAEGRWRDEIGRALGTMARTLKPAGRVVLVLADSAVAGAPLRAIPVVEAAGRDAGLGIDAIASQPRPHFHLPTRRAFSDAPREEHLIALSGRAPPIGAK
jgi:adenine-specific DNA methylase